MLDDEINEVKAAEYIDKIQKAKEDIYERTKRFVPPIHLEDQCKQCKFRHWFTTKDRGVRTHHKCTCKTDYGLTFYDITPKIGHYCMAFMAKGRFKDE